MTGTASDSRDLTDLQPHVRAIAEQLLEDAGAAGIPLTVTSTLRSSAIQAARFAQGRTTPGRIVTNAPAGYSYHEFGMAFDVVPTELLALRNWGDTPEHQAHADALWATIGSLGKALGLRWGGDFTHLRDRPHFEWAGGLTLAELRAGRESSVRIGGAA